ncbi:TIGR01212 family radical SAM protein [Engelhardtia mirabilis]|uniref:Coproporphyrinogen III oxidase n=1 Tax=Engelhardtia mirabilis TaxID=2528011 RepID=A0A518BJ65_9BACT|nr:coproporphyrinogen III oxidase [Planctomycetes bacterium Pla133]QDV01346.1 coproporphyrinogen III oxidase [Planctomycetes bacterium Pla86]
MHADLRFRPLRPYLIERFGHPIHRVALDAGSTCPNRDGTKGYGGCVYCDVEGSGTGALRTGSELAQQLSDGIRRVVRRDPEFGVIAYFQSYSNTYVEPQRLDQVLSIVEARLEDGIEVVAVSTRPDTLPEWAVDRLRRLAERVSVWVELGLEVADDGILERIKRFHTVEEFEQAVERCHAAGLEVVGHAILGLPGDGRDGARRSAEVLARSKCAGVKVHNLMVLRRTVLERWWRDGEVEILEPETYVSWLADFVERLGPDQVLHRITGDAPLEERLAPRWDLHKSAVRDLLNAELAARGTRQGSLHPTLPGVERGGR